MRRRDQELSKGWGQIATPLPVETSGGKQRLNCANTEGILRLVQSIPSPKAEPFKLWLTQVGYERIQEIENPELAQERMKQLYEQKGYPKEWIDKRLCGIAIRQNLTDEWHDRGITSQQDYAILTAEISKATFGMTPNEYKQYKRLPSKSKINLIEIILNSCLGFLLSRGEIAADSIYFFTILLESNTIRPVKVAPFYAAVAYSFFTLMFRSHMMKLFDKSTNKLSDGDRAVLARFVKEDLIKALERGDRTITEVNFNGGHSLDNAPTSDENRFGDREMGVLMQLLKNNPQVTKLEIWGCNLSAAGVSLILQNQSITGLDLNLSSIDEEGIALLSCSLISDLAIGDRWVTEQELEMLAASTSIKSLALNGSGITNNGAKILARNNTIVELNLCCNELTPTAANYIARGCKALKKLDISGNRFGDDGAIEFINHPGIVSLNLEVTELTHVGANRLLLENTVITELHLSENGLLEVDKIAEAIAQNRTLESLTMYECKEDPSERGLNKIFENTSILECDLGILQIDRDEEKVTSWLQRNEHRNAAECADPITSSATNLAR